MQCRMRLRGESGNRESTGNIPQADPDPRRLHVRLLRTGGNKCRQDVDDDGRIIGRTKIAMA